MPKVIVTYKNEESLKALQQLAKEFDMVIEVHDPKKVDVSTLPIRFAKNPDANSLSGIWKDNPQTLEEIRKKAWEIGCEIIDLRHQYFNFRI